MPKRTILHHSTKRSSNGPPNQSTGAKSPIGGGRAILKPTILHSTSQAAELLHVSPRTLEKWRVAGAGPVYLKIGRLCFYDDDAIKEWLTTRTRRSTSDRGGA
jgi:hypothetical protein